MIYFILQRSSAAPSPGNDKSALEKAKKGSRALKKADAKKKLLLMPSLVTKNCLTDKELSARLAKIIKKIIADLDFEDKEFSARLAKIIDNLEVEDKEVYGWRAKILSDLKKMDDLHLEDKELSARLAKIDCEIKRLIADL